MRFFLFIVLFSFQVFAGEPKPYTKNDRFIDGYDPVSYIKSNKAKKGLSDFKTDYKGVSVYFASEANKKDFESSPEKYWPQYGGYCAYALAVDNGLVEVNPERFKVIEGKTYLFYDDSPGIFSVNTLKKWNKKDDQKQIVKADKSWAKESN